MAGSAKKRSSERERKYERGETLMQDVSLFCKRRELNQWDRVNSSCKRDKSRLSC